jgi:hypothetical protein
MVFSLLVYHLPAHVGHVRLGPGVHGIALPVQGNAFPREREAENAKILLQFLIILIIFKLTMLPPWLPGRR